MTSILHLYDLFVSKRLVEICFVYLSLLDFTRSRQFDRNAYKELGEVLEDYGHVNRPKPAVERWYDPYWEDGHWVFNRVKLQSTEHPLGHMLQKGKYTKHHDCNQICLGIYETYGEICAQRFVTRKHRWRYEYKQFHNMCYLEYENCKELNKRWYPIHKGNCPEFKKMTKNPTDPSKAAKRVTRWLKRIKEKQIGVGIDSYE